MVKGKVKVKAMAVERDMTVDGNLISNGIIIDGHTSSSSSIILILINISIISIIIILLIIISN
jgi:hypothetical protein